MECNRANLQERDVLRIHRKVSHALGNTEKVLEKEEKDVQRFL